MNRQPEIDEAVDFVGIGLVVEGGLILLALLLAWWGLYDHHQPLNLITLNSLGWASAWGVAATLPMLTLFGVQYFWRPRWMQPMWEFVDERLRPVFQQASTGQIVLMAVLAGLGEELFFRWCVQGGLTSVLEPHTGALHATVIGLVLGSASFSLCHCVNAAYGWTTLIVGFYFGIVMLASGSFLVPAVSHTLYDLIAMLCLAKLPAPRDQHKSP